jgi:secreted trypsin-like serine protease
VALAYPGFKAEVKEGRVASFEGDLAVVRLAQPLPGVRIDAQLPKTEVAIDESLVMVGFGDTQKKEHDGGQRRFGRNVVTDIQLASGGNGAFAFRALGAHTHGGDSGGPCFRESRSGRWLVGINMGSANAGTISLFTSTFHYRAWIADQISSALRD